MDHKLRVLVRLDLDRSAAVLEVSGCLTAETCDALVSVIRRTGTLIEGVGVVGGMVTVVDLRDADHIDSQALKELHRAIYPTEALERAGTAAHPVKILSPRRNPRCGQASRSGRVSSKAFAA